MRVYWKKTWNLFLIKFKWKEKKKEVFIGNDAELLILAENLIYDHNFLCEHFGGSFEVDFRNRFYVVAFKRSFSALYGATQSVGNFSG
jgi:hypothetical protein